VQRPHAVSCKTVATVLLSSVQAAGAKASENAHPSPSGVLYERWWLTDKISAVLALYWPARRTAMPPCLHPANVTVLLPPVFLPTAVWEAARQEISLSLLRLDRSGHYCCNVLIGQASICLTSSTAHQSPRADDLHEMAERKLLQTTGARWVSGSDGAHGACSISPPQRFVLPSLHPRDCSLPRAMQSPATPNNQKICYYLLARG
jgi:hypothetical protein